MPSSSAFPFVGKSGVFTIAEVGGNHEGDFVYAKELVSQACATNVDAVKLQVYSPDLLVNPAVDKNRHEHFKRFALARHQYDELFDIIRRSGKQVSASVWSIAELTAFIDRLDFVKIGSGDLTDALILDAIRDSGKPVILSTGLSTMVEIEWAMERLDYRIKQSRIGVLQCTSMYPIPDIDSNLLVVQALQQRFGCVVGYSDHTVGYKALELSAAAGARIQEFHFTDSREGKTFRDHLVSLTPAETDQLIECNIKTMTLLGTAHKEPALSEVVAGHTRSFRKGLFLNRDMAKGQAVTRDDLIALRPEAGFPASRANEVIGCVLARDVQRLEPLDPACFSRNRGN
jgi:N,N'-diacetyllegionaminate synthase